MPAKPHSYILVFDEAVAADSSAEKRHRIPFDGTVTRCHISFRGTGFLVDVIVFLGRDRRQDRILPGPDDDVLNLADDTLDWPLNIPVASGQDITVQWANRDTATPNRVPVLLLIEPS